MSPPSDDLVGGDHRLSVIRDLVRTGAAPMSSRQRTEGQQIVMERLAIRRGRRLRWATLSLGGALALAAGVALWVGVTRLTGAGTLSFKVEGGEIGDGGYIRSFGADGVAMRFDEGTELRLVARSRGRLSDVDSHGARLAIEEGEAHVQVTPRPGARWLVYAGPFLITVRGTAFTASWNGATERLDVDMEKGLVSITGPLAEGPIALRGGQHLTVNMERKEVVLRDRGAPADKVSAPKEPALAPPATGDGGTVPAARAPVRGPSRSRGARVTAPQGLANRSWSVALAGGELDAILTDAERRGIARSLAESSSDDLSALADAARYRRRDELAHRALTAERDRFPQSARARDAAFFLGRIEEGRPNGDERAVAWYDRYLREAPSGAYSSEALGRKMTAIQRLQGVAAARAVAAEYLRRFPNGTYATTARAVQDTP